MICEPVLCNGNDLARVLLGLEDRNMVPWAVDTMVNGHNAEYKVSYFSHNASAEKQPTKLGMAESALQCTARKPVHVNAAASEGRANSRNEMLRGPSADTPAQGSYMLKSSVEADGPSEFPNKSQCSSGTSESRPHPAPPVKGVVSAAQLTRMNGAAGVEQRPEKVKSVMDAPASISIEDRMIALQESMRKSGRLKRSKPKIDARHPHNDP